MRKTEKFYTFLEEEQKQYLSLNFLLAEKIHTNSFVSQLGIKHRERKAVSEFHCTSDHTCLLCYKHISRYIDEIDQYKKELI